MHHRSGDRLSLSVLLAVVTVSSSACGSDSREPPETFDAVVEAADCSDVEELDPMIFPIRGQAASRGLECTRERDRFHLFARAPEGDPNAGAYAVQEGGSLENVYRSMGVEGAPDDCVYLAVGEVVLVVAQTEEALAAFVDDVGIDVDPAVPAQPSVSYLNGCTVD